MSGTSKKKRYILVSEVFNNLPRDAVPSLSPFHALSGCDTTSFFANHSKKTSWKTFLQHYALIKQLGLGDLTDETIQSCETFVCRMYNVQTTDSVNDARHVMFSKTSKPEAMPPTSDALRFHLMHVHYQTIVWRNANCANPDLPDPTDLNLEWRQTETGLQPVLLSVDPIPKCCLEMIACSCQKQCRMRRCKCQKSGLRCTAICACQQKSDEEMTCMNLV